MIINLSSDHDNNQNFFVLNAENTKLVYKLFEKIISTINSRPELLNLMRQEDDEEQKTDNDGDANKGGGLLNFLCCSDRNKNKNKKENLAKKEAEDYENIETNQGIDDDYEMNEVDNVVNARARITNGKIDKKTVSKKTSESEPEEKKSNNSSDVGCILF